MLLGCWDSANQFIISPLPTKYATMRVFCSDTISEIQKNYKERLTYTCLSSSPAVCSENKLSGEPQTISSCHVPAPVQGLTWYDRARRGKGQASGLDEDSKHVTQTMSIIFIIAHGWKMKMPVVSHVTFSTFSSYITQREPSHKQ